MTLLDCTFSFFTNFPCRLTVSEMKFELPCEEIFFSSPHPFSERSFTFSRRVTVCEAYQSLFPQQKSTSSTSDLDKKSNPLGLNPMDMFILIHSTAKSFLFTSDSKHAQRLTNNSTLYLYFNAHHPLLLTSPFYQPALT